jgi:iron complex outermembrane recepter protein
MTIRYLPALAPIAFLAASSALAAERWSFDIPAQRLDTALIELGKQAGISIGGVGWRIGEVRSRSVRGRMTIQSALKTMLRNTGFDYLIVDAATVRIVRAPPPPTRQVATPKRPKPPPPLPRRKQPLPRPPPQHEPETDAPAEIIVTGTKQGQSLDSYAGTAHILNVGLQGMDAFEGTKALIDRLPTISGTNLGPGRNKLFIRGVSDSSFTGPTQATVGLYLGDLRLTYNAPDPDLRLYDIDQIEVIEGPQGTLYGAGSLGGIVRIIPKPPTSDNIHASAVAGVSSIQGGSTGNDGALSLNLPIARDVLAIRVLGYHQIEGGYIDDPGQNLRSVNSAKIGGWRAALRLTPGDDWTVDVGLIAQNINTRDSQYSERGLPKLSRSAQLRQPFDNNIAARYITIMKHWDNVDLVAVTSRVRHDLTSVFDATSPLDPDNVLVFDEDEEVRMTNHEARLSGRIGGEGTWVLGINQVRNKDTVIRSMGPPDDIEEFARLKNETSERAIFGEGTYRIFGDVSATLGARVVRATSAGEVIGLTNDEAEPVRRSTRFLPTAALTWKPRTNLITFLRYQSGFRGGGIAVSGPNGDVATRFVPDKIQTVELGVRHGNGDDRFSGGAALFYTDWRDIQADLLKPDGLPYTDNIGRGRIYGIEANANWKPISGVTFDLGMFANKSKLFNPAPGLLSAGARSLPNIPGFGARGSVSYVERATATTDFKIDANFRYVGRSRLGAVPPLIFEQGNFTEVGMSAALINEKWRLTLEATNLFDITGNSFAYGNPFSVAQGQQITPLRPRTVRLGAQIGF